MFFGHLKKHKAAKEPTQAPTPKAKHNPLNILLGFITLCIVIAYWNFTSQAAERFAIMAATLGNAFLILYFTHWRNHKHDISLDAIIKLFASGFVLAVVSAVVIELILSIFSAIVLMIVVGMELQADGIVVRPGTTGIELAQYALKHHMVTLVVFVFFKSFVEAALVEELSKYYSYFMVEHGDFIFGTADAETEATCDSTGVQGTMLLQQHNGESSTKARAEPLIPRVTLSPSATASAVTVAMVATATGFSCSENLQYVFGQQSVQAELLVLVIRALLPVHSLCAAIQSIGVVRRDIEKDRSWGIGWAIFPAVVLHGTFDFVLMVIALFQFRNLEPPPSYDTSAYAPPEENVASSLSLNDVVAALVPGLIIMGLGLLYYGACATAQRLRLGALDRNHPDVVLSPPFV